MTDRDRISTRQLNRLRRRILRVYGTARREMTEQLTEFWGSTERWTSASGRSWMQARSLRTITASGCKIRSFSPI